MNFDLDFYKGKKVFVTGHTGFKGSWLCKMLANAGAIVTGYSLNPPTSPSLFEIAGIEQDVHSVIGDIRDFKTLKAAFDEAQPEMVLHLAAQPIVRDSYKDPAYTYETNVMGSALEHIHINLIHRMVTYVQDKDSKNIFSRIIGPYRKLIYALIILLCVAVLFLYSSLLPIIIALTGRFEGQLEFLSGGISMYWPYWLIMSLPIFLLFRRYNVRRSMDEEYSFLYLMFALSIILFQVIGINSESYRISLYFMQFLILLMVTESVTNQCTANFDRKAERVFKLFNEVLSDCLTDKIKIGLQYKGLCLYTQFLQVDCFNIGIKDNFRHRMTRCIEVCKKNFFPSMVTDIYNYMSNYERLTWKAVKLKSPFLIFVFYKIRMRKLKEKR